MASEVARDPEMKGIPWWASVMSGLFLIVGAVTSRKKRKKKKRPLNFNVQKKINWLPVSKWELQEECVLWMCVLRTMRFPKNSKMGSIFILSAYHELTMTRLPMNRVKSVLAASEFWCVAPQPGPSDCRIGIVFFFWEPFALQHWAQGWAGESSPHGFLCSHTRTQSHPFRSLIFFVSTNKKSVEGCTWS